MTAPPIIIASPSTRSGTTLLQRLISSSRNGICYGEHAARRLIEQSEFAHKEFLQLDGDAKKNEFNWKEFTNGNMNHWMVGLELPGDYTKHALVSALAVFKQHYDQATESLQREVWACKTPKLSFMSVVRLADFFDDLKCIYIYRNIVDVIKSQKSKGWLDGSNKLEASCLEWVENTNVVAALVQNNFENTPKMLHPIEYEAFVSDPVAGIERLEEFTGVFGIQHNVLNAKVNTWLFKSGGDMTPEISYSQPSTLTTEEGDTIRRICGARMREIYPNLKTELDPI